jgi:hypothetical protein
LAIPARGQFHPANLAIAPFDTRFAQLFLGHSSIATTETCIQVFDEALRATLERADVLGTLNSG